MQATRNTLLNSSLVQHTTRQVCVAYGTATVAKVSRGVKVATFWVDGSQDFVEIQSDTTVEVNAPDVVNALYREWLATPVVHPKAPAKTVVMYL